MISALQRLGTPAKYLRIIRALYKSPVFFVSDTFGRSRLHHMHQGVRQGDGLSCFLFIAVLSVIFYDAERSWRRETAHDPDSDRIVRLFGREAAKYADDSNLFSCSVKVLQVMLHCLQREARRYNLELNLAKTWLIPVGAARNQQPSMQDLDGRPVLVTDSHETLGFVIGQVDRVSAQVRRKGRDMLQAMNRYRLVWQSTLTRKQKVDRYFSLVVAKAVWGVHQLTLLPADFGYLEYLHARCLRRILRRKAAFVSRVSHADIRRDAAAPTMTSLIRQRQFIRLGKLLRKPEDHPDRLACFEPGTDLKPRLPNGTHRRRGRPRTVWAETLLPLCEERWNATRAEILRLATNKRDWQQRIESLSRSL